MPNLRVTGKRFAAALLLAACTLLTMPALALAQESSPAPDTGTDVWNNMPGSVIVLIPIVIGAALYLSFRLANPERVKRVQAREGPVSRALAQQEDA